MTTSNTNPANNMTPFLAANPCGVMSTIAGGEVRSRIFQYLWSDGNKVYFCTSNKKDVYAQLKQNPQANFCVYDPAGYASLSIRGKAVFVNDMAAKKRALDDNPSIKGIYESPENPDFEVFYLDIEGMDGFDFVSGKVSKKV